LLHEKIDLALSALKSNQLHIENSRFGTLHRLRTPTVRFNRNE
jgi:hypothetical protein